MEEKQNMYKPNPKPPVLVPSDACLTRSEHPFTFSEPSKQLRYHPLVQTDGFSAFNSSW